MSSTNDFKRMTRSSQKSQLQIEVVDLTSSPASEHSFSSVTNSLPRPFIYDSEVNQYPAQGITVYPPECRLPYLSKQSLKLLRQKQTKLQSTASSVLTSLEPLTKKASSSSWLSGDESTDSPLQHVLLSTMIFAGEDAGTAVVIHDEGWILTCAHCFADSYEEWTDIVDQDMERGKTLSSATSTSSQLQNREKSDRRVDEAGDDPKRRWLLFYDGTAACVECLILDSRRDLALGRIIGLETISYHFPNHYGSPTSSITFTHLPISSNTPKRYQDIYCIGQPGPLDLETTTPNKKTNYPLFSVSSGRFRGLVKGQDPDNNEEIGCLKHDAWTYWGHSGAPLVSWQDSGTIGLIGMHSSWDEDTAMRHGVPAVAIQNFLMECGKKLTVDFSI